MPDHFINVPMLPKKLMRWNPPSISTIFIDFSLIISVAFNHNPGNMSKPVFLHVNVLLDLLQSKLLNIYKTDLTGQDQ